MRFRSFSSALLTSSVGLGVGVGLRTFGNTIEAAGADEFKVEPLPYDYSALEPYISAETLKFHFDKHHKGYAAKLNAASLTNSEIKGKSYIDLIRSQTGPVFNNAAQVWNHTFYWKSMAPARQAGSGLPQMIRQAINESFGSFDEFKKQFSAAAGGHFGSGWAWLVVNPKTRTLSIVQTHDADTPIRKSPEQGGDVPLLCCDVWEHAFYIDYRNDKAKYIESWWNLVNWDFAETNFRAAVDGSSKQSKL